MTSRVLNRSMFICALIVITGLSTIHAAPSGQADDSGEEVIIGKAPVDSVELLILESFPVQIRALVRGNLPDPCTEISGFMQTLQGSEILISLSTERPVEAICAMVLAPYEESIPVDIAGLPMGTYNVTVNGVSVSLMLDETMIPPAATVPEPESCPPATNETESYRDRIAGYCLLYPAGYRIDAALPGVLTISAPLVNDVAEVRPSLYIITVPGEGLSLPEVRAEMTEQYPDAALVVSEITIGGQPAIIIGIPRDVMSNRQGFIVYQDDLYILLAEPVDAAYPKATPVTENLWQVVIASLTFMAPTERATLVPQTFADLGLSIMMPDDWTVEAQPGVYHLMSFDPTRQGAPFTISLGSISGLPSDDFEAMISAALADFEAQGERSLVYEPFITGNGAMVGATIFGLQRVCRMMLIPGVDLVRTITVRMDTCNDAGGISDPVVSAILNSVTLLDVAE